MSYTRVIPRDLFNEANLLKCYGQIYLLLERMADHKAELVQEDDGSFQIEQDQNSGALSIENITLRVHGKLWRLMRPLNSRAPWPLWLEHIDPAADFEPIQVFTDDGNFTEVMRGFIL